MGCERSWLSQLPHKQPFGRTSWIRFPPAQPMKICTACKISKEEKEFSFSNIAKGILHAYCKMCGNAKSHITYLNNKERINKRSLLAQKNRTISNRQYIWDYLKEHPCIHCGESDPVVLEFNHIKSELKIANVSFLVKKTLKVLKAEIEKCEVLCANCHRRHTAKQFNYYSQIIK